MANDLISHAYIMNPCTTRLGLLPGWPRWAWEVVCPESMRSCTHPWIPPTTLLPLTRPLYNKPPVVGNGYSSRLPNLRKRAVITPSALLDSSQPFPLKPTRLLCPWVSQARILEWVDISFSRGSSRLRDRTYISCISKSCRQILYHWAIAEGWQEPSN